MRAVTDFVLENCPDGETVYINIDSDGYSGTTFAYSDPTHPELQSKILWESSVPSTHGFPTGIWTSRYVMVTDKFDTGTLVGYINRALRTDTPAAGHYAYVTEFSLANGVTLYCYQRTSPPDSAEADYFKQLFAEFDAAGRNCTASASTVFYRNRPRQAQVLDGACPARKMQKIPAGKADAVCLSGGDCCIPVQGKPRPGRYLFLGPWPFSTLLVPCSIK